MKLKLINLILFLYFLTITFSTNANYLDGLNAFEEQNYNLAFENWSEIAEDDRLSQFYLGYLYKNGLGVNIDYDKAFKFFKKASDNGLLEGHYNLALFFYKGLGIEKNYKLAFKYFDLSKEKIKNSNYYLGLMFLKGFGVEKDYIKAVEYFKISSGVITDSRTLKNDCLFVALKGKNFDGNKFAIEAIKKGAKFAIVDSPSVAKKSNKIILHNYYLE